MYVCVYSRVHCKITPHHNVKTPCADAGFEYGETEVHSFGPIRVAVDMYNEPEEEYPVWIGDARCCETCPNGCKDLCKLQLLLCAEVN